MLSIVRSFARKVGYALCERRRRSSVCDAREFVRRSSLRAHIVNMKTFQVSRRVLVATGVLAASLIGSVAATVDCLGLGAGVTGGTTENDCTTCVTAAGYILKTPAALADCTDVAVVENPAANGVYFAGGHSITDATNNLDAMSDTAGIIAGTANPTAGDEVLFAAMTGFGQCPTATTTMTSQADAADDCNVIMCQDIPLNGQIDATTGGAVQTSSANNDGSATFDICVTAPGHYLYSVASAATAVAGIQIEKAPANYYAPGQQNVVNGAVYNVAATANMAADSSSNALVTACPTNSNSFAGSSLLADCECAANFYPSNNACVACASGTTRAGTVSVTGTATCSAAASPTAASPTAASPTAESAGASTPIAVALAAAAAVPLLL